MPENIYIKLTDAFNRDGLRAVICSGQAVVLHRLAVMSKDGDWIIREDEASLEHILSVLEKYGATYRFGAPLDAQWMRQGWSSHFEFPFDGIRVRTDFFSRPPRLSNEELQHLWVEQDGKALPFTSVRDLVKIKMTQREKDYPVIGELARLMTAPGDQLLYSRSVFDLIQLCREHPELARQLSEDRPLLNEAMGPDADPDIVGKALDAERRSLIRADAERVAVYQKASFDWRELWPSVRGQIDGLPLSESHAIVLREAEECLPKNPAP